MLPHASGVATARTARMMGAFQGAMPSTTPAGWRMPMASEPGTSEGITSPLICVVSDAASRIMPAASITLKPAHMPVAPVSAATASRTAAPWPPAFRGLEQQHAALAGAGFAPGLESLGRRLHRHHGIRRRGGRRARGDRAIQRIAALEGGVLFRRDLQAVDQHGQIGHFVLLRAMDHRTAWAWRWGSGRAACCAAEAAVLVSELAAPR